MESKRFSYTAESGWENLPDSSFDSERTLLLAFFSPDVANDSERFKELSQHFPKAKIVGCSTSGEISEDTMRDHSITVVGCKFLTTDLHIASVKVESASDSKQVGAELAGQFTQDDLKGVIVLSDGLAINGSELVAGLNSGLAPEVIVGGGLAGDGDRFENTFTLMNGEVVKDHVLAVGLMGKDLHIQSSASGGWDIFGPNRLVTKSDANILYEIDNEPALALYKKYLGEKAKELPGSALLFPLLVSQPNDPDYQLVRTILNIDEEKQSMTFAGNIPEGAQVRLMKANFEHLIDAAGEAAEQVQSEVSKDSQAVSLLFSCVGRRLVLGPRVEEELEAVKEVLGSDVIGGFYTYGEICAFSKGKETALHNETMTIVRFWEDAA